MVTRAIIAGGGVVLLSVSVAGLSTNGFGYWKTIPWQALSQESDYSSSGTNKDKFGGKNAKYLTGLSEINNEWWNNKYKEFEKQKPTVGKFASVDNSDDSKSLKKVCEEAYKAEDSQFQTNSDTSSEKFKKEEVWQFCSKGGTKPQTVDAFNTGKEEGKKEKYNTGDNGSSNFGETKKANLLSINSPDNSWVWTLKNEEFSKESISESGHFRTAKEGGKSVKSACEEAYKKQANSTDDDKLTETDVLKWCSLEGK